MAIDERYNGYVFINVYRVNRDYGGPEEGGWWYDTGEFVECHPVKPEDARAKYEEVEAALSTS